MSETPEWLDETQEAAWAGLRAVLFRAFPEMERTLKAHGLLAVHYHIFVSLSSAPDRTLRLSDLADAADMSQSRLTHRMRSLVKRGEVAITEDPDDGRAKNATLTDLGQSRLDELAPLHIADVRRLLFDPLTDEQTAALADAVTTIADHLCEHPEFLNPQSG
ncbi:MAG: MarR family transcriptional regulator [Actinomycetota bacterium]